MKYIDVILHSVYSDLRTEVSRRFFGFFWWILEPLLYMGTFYVVFGIALNQGDEHYASFLLTGMVLWKWFDGSVRLASASISNSFSLSQQIYLPKLVFVIIPLLTNTFKFFIIFTLLLAFLLIKEDRSLNHPLALVAVLLCQFYFTFCMSVLLASIIPFFQDLRQIIDNFMMLLMFMSGIFYRVPQMSGEISELFQYNPAYLLVQAFRDVLLVDSVPDWSALGYVLLVGLPMALVGLLVIIHNDRHYPKILV